MSAFLITLRETLEAAIIIGLIFSILKVFWAGWDKKIYIVYGVIAWIICSFLFSMLLEYTFWSFEWKVEKIYEGVLMLLAAWMITHFVLWTNAHFSHLWTMIKKWVEKALNSWQIWMLSILAFVSVIREWVETVIFLKSAEFAGTSGGAMYAIGWFLVAICIALVLFYIIKSINIASVIKATNVLFLLLGAGLLSHAISEFEGGGVIPKIMKPLFDLNTTFLTEKEWFWALLKAAFSYDADPSLVAFLAYVFYILIVGYFLFIHKNKKIA